MFKKTLCIFILILSLIFLPFQEAKAATYNAYAAVSLTGGTTGSLDNIDGSSLNNGDLAIVITTDFNAYFYTLDADSGAAESSPDVITPDSTAGTKRWILTAVYGSSGDITDVYDCNTGNCTSIALSDTDLLDMSAVSVNSATEGLFLPQHATNCSASAAEGQVCWEADDNLLYIGNGATATQVGTGHGDGANCSAGEIPLGVNASGAVQGCYEPTEADITDLSHTATAITDGLIVEVDLDEDSGTPTDEDVLTYDSTGANFNWIAQSSLVAGTATALVANGSNCNAGEIPLGVDAAGAVEGCYEPTEADISDLAHIPEAGDYSNLTAGRSLTHSPTGTVVADAELYTDTKCINIDPDSSTTDWFMWRAPVAVTITGVDCIVDAATSVVMTPKECDANGGSCVDIEAAITCLATNTTEASTVDNASIDAGDYIRVLRGTKTGSPTQATLCLEMTYDD